MYDKFVIYLHMIDYIKHTILFELKWLSQPFANRETIRNSFLISSYHNRKRDNLRWLALNPFTNPV